jgi:hypothetical protein
MPSQKSCPMKFGTAVNTEGLLIEIPCIKNDCAWFFDNHCAILILAKELCTTNQKKKSQKEMRAD